MTAQEAADAMVALLDEYADCFGLCDHDGPSQSDETHHSFSRRQCEFEDKFNAIVCAWKGHTISQDHLCFRCKRPASEIGW